MAKERVIHYRDELNDDFAGNSINTCKITKEFPFAPVSLGWRILEWIAYYVIAMRLVSLFCYVFCGFTFKNRSAVRRLKKTHKGGFFIYANHTHFSDGFVNPIAALPTKVHVIVNPDAVSIKGLRSFVQMVGAIPLPTEISGMPKFMEALKLRLDQGRAIAIFPEAHIWPYCNFVRPFRTASFKYPCKWNCPVIAAAVTYQKHRILKFIKAPRRTVYISEAFYPDTSLPPQEAADKLRNEVYAFLDETTKKYSTYEYVRYIKDDAE